VNSDLPRLLDLLVGGAATNVRVNNLNFLRLIFASLVILSHSPELVDGNRSRELATRLWGTMSFGEIGVDAFFVVSGYLITASYLASSSVSRYMLSRVLRIYPAYLAAYAICVLVLAPLVGGDLTALTVAKNGVRMLILETPSVPGTFPGLHYPALNGPMWTIGYEFRCYLLVILLGACGLLRQRLIVSLALVLLAITPLLPKAAYYFPFGSVQNNARFAGIFLTGAAFYLYRDQIKWDLRYASIVTIILFGSLFLQVLAEPAFAILGGYLIFSVGFAAPVLAPWTNRFDISYGTYLYAWPIQNTLIYAMPDFSPWAVFFIALLGSFFCGLISYSLIERRALSLKPGRLK
jgi:peptidoglycan/LPS O-acetylase OafA/YrhL